MSADSPRRSSGGATRGMVAVPAIVPPQVVSDRSILDSAIGFINEVTLAHQPLTEPKDTITWARFETAADISDPRFGEDWELEGNVAPPLLLILGYGLGVQVWAIPANGEAVEVLSWRHGIVSALRVLPTPSPPGAIEENGRADEPTDAFAEKRPLIALVDGSSSSGSQPQFCAVNFISLKTGTQVKTIKFKNSVIDILANRSSIVITFHERIAVFDARTLEDRLSITTCYPSPGINPNPVALGPRWLAYAEHKLLHSKRSGGGCDGDGVASYTATVLNASKSLVKGLRELGEQVAAGLTGTSGSAGNSKNTSFDSGMGADSKQPGIVTIIDAKIPFREYSPTSGAPMSSNQSAGADPIIAHFIAHSDALVSMEFDNSGMLLVTADRRGHDFHVFRIQPNPVGSSLAAVHHLYVLHRGDTSAKVQNISLSLDSRWVAVSTLRGTTHVFPITPYGGPMGVRTHTSLHVVNKLSRFHRSAGLSAEGRSNSPITHSESTTFTQSLQPYHNPTLPPFHRPTVVIPLAQLRQPFALGSPPGSATLAGVKSVTGGVSGSGSQRQRLSSLSDDNGKPLSVCAIFAKSRSWLLDPPNVTREAPHRMQRKAVDSLFVMAGHGALIQYDLDTKLAANVAKERICDDTPIELEVEAKAQWNLGRRKEGSQEIMPPLLLDNWLVKNRNSCMLTDSTRHYDDTDDRSESWLAQVEIVTHAGPHRRLWMGPQFVFKTYNTPSGSNLSHVDIEAVEIGTSKTSTATSTAAAKTEHSSPLNMPITAAGRSSAVPVLIESGSYSSIEQSPKLMDRFRHDHLDSDYAVAHGDTRLKEDLADAMRESPCVAASSKDSGRGCETVGGSGDNVAFYDALTDHDDQDDQEFIHARTASAAALASALPNIHSYDNSLSYESLDSLKRPKPSIEKIVNPFGTVTTVTSCLAADVKTDILDEVVSQLAAEDTVIHENCDESLFRPVVAIFCDEKTRLKNEEEARKNQEHCQPPELISNKLVVPVIAKEVDDELNKKEKQKNKAKYMVGKEIENLSREQSKFDELSSLNKKSKEAIAKEEDEKAKNIKHITAVKEKERHSLENKTAVAKEYENRTQTPSKSSEVVSDKIEIECLKKLDNKKTKTATEKRISPEKENCIKNQGNSKEISNTLQPDHGKANILGEETPIEFIPMTPKVAEKVTVQKILSKKEIKKQHQKAQDESIKQSSGNENSKHKQVERQVKTEEIKQNLGSVKSVEDTTVNKIKTEIDHKNGQEIADKKSSKENNNNRITEENEKDIINTVNENIITELKKEIPKEALLSKSNMEDTKSTAITLIKKDQMKCSQIKKEDKATDLQFKQMTATSEDKTKTQTAFNVALSAINKTAIKEEKDDIKTKKLNVNDLADSLIELEDHGKKIECIEEEIRKTEIKKEDKNKMESKSCKKNKKKGNKSGSSSENEELVEVSTPSTSKAKSNEKFALKQNASSSSDDSYTDLADSLLERKDILEENMFVSFTHTEERTTSSKDQEGKLKKLNTTEQLMECYKHKESGLDTKNNVEIIQEASVSDKSSEDAVKVKNVVMTQEQNVIKSKATDKLETNQEQSVTKIKETIFEVKKSQLKSKNIEKELSKEDKIHAANIKKPLKEEKSNQNTSETVSEDKANFKKTTEVDLKKSEEKSEIKPLIETKTSALKTTDNEKIVDSEKTKNLSEKDKKGTFTKSEETKKEVPKKNIKTNAENSEQRVPKVNNTNVEEPKKEDITPIMLNTKADKQETVAIKEKQIRVKDSNISDEKKSSNSKVKQEQVSEDTTAKINTTQNTMQQTAKESLDKESSYKKPEKTEPVSPKNKSKEATKDINKMAASTIDHAAVNIEATKKCPSLSHLKEDKRKEELTKTISNKKEIIEEDTLRIKGNEVSKDTTDATEIVKSNSSKKVIDKTQYSTVLTPPPPKSAWKTLSGAEMISKNLNKPNTDTIKFPSLGAIGKSNSSKISATTEKLLPELPTPKEMEESLCLGKISKKTKKSSGLHDFPILKPLDSLPPLPALEPLELVTDAKSRNLKEFSLINFESPLQENPALQRKITPPPRGFTEQNLIFALCGSLHYENEHVVTRASPDKPDSSPTLSSNRSSSALDEPSMADYKSLTENDDPYISLEQSSQDTNTTNTNTTNEKLSSSTNSSGSEEIITMEEKKMTKKQKRKRQQQVVELQKQKEQQHQLQQEMDDEELRPLIAMTESQIDQIPSDTNTNLPTLMDESFSMKALTTQPLTQSTTTDSEGPMPATTSDDNVFTIPASVAHSQHKIKTKKLEHKINLIAAIEAATSSSTSSAEESGVELGGRRSSHDNDESVISVANSVAATTLPLPIVVASQTTAGGLKKKTKRRKR